MSDETADMIRRAAVELGYEPLAAARSLIARRTGALALALPYAAAFWDANPFNEAILHGAAEAAARLGCDLLLHTRRNHAWQQHDASALMSPHADGVVVVAPPVGSPLLASLAEADYPAVAAVCDPDECPIPSANAADAEGARAAVTYLIRLGHRRIGHLLGPAELGPSRARRDGYRAAMRAAGLEVPETLIARTAPDERGGFRATVELLARSPRPTALFAFSDLVARGAIDAARQMGLAVPAQLSVVGFDDAAFAAEIDPPLTTVRYPARAIASAAIELLARLTLDRDYTADRRRRAAHPRPAPHGAPALILPTELVVRASGAPPAADSSR